MSADMNFVAFDFETANEKENSACELGISVVKNGEIAESKSWLIRPPEMRFNRFNTWLHGISAEKVQDEPTFDVLWLNEIKPYFEGKLLIAHNIKFDIGVLRQSLDTYHLPYPKVNFICSVTLSRMVWQGLASYKLNKLCLEHSIDLDHHRAESDANGCAAISLKAFEDAGVQSIFDIENKLNMKVGRLIAMNTHRKHKSSSNLFS